MADLLFVVITVAFFAVAVGFVRVCDRIIGPDDAVVTAPDRLEVVEPEGAEPDGTDAHAVEADGADDAGADPMSADNVVGLVVSVLIVAYLVVALVFPERF